MASRTIYSCDVCGRESANTAKKSIPVVFLTEQTEGRSTTPYLTTTTVDICPGCEQRLVRSFPLTASGAQGHNTFEWTR